MVQALHFFLSPRKSGPTVVNPLHKWLIPILWKNAEASNSQIHSMVVPKSPYTATGNYVFGYFRSATNSVNATGASANFRVRKYFSLDCLEKCYSYKQLQHLLQRSLRLSLHFYRKWQNNILPVDSKLHKPVNVGPCFGRDFSITAQPISKRFTVL